MCYTKKTQFEALAAMCLICEDVKIKVDNGHVRYMSDLLGLEGEFSFTCFIDVRAGMWIACKEIV